MPLTESTPRLLVVDDEPSVLKVVERFARLQGFEVVIRSSGEEALACFADVKPDVALIDLRMSGLTGIDVLRVIRAADPECEVILMTGNATVDTAIDAVKSGALDYLAKPLDFDRLRELLVTVREKIGRRERLLEVDAVLAKQFEFYGMIGRSPAMQDLFDLIRRLAPHVRTVLIVGETGTGKELVARALQKLGPRRDRRFVTVNCSAVVETLFESELFGHVRGAFTGATETKVGLFEHADGGTLFLDEAGELPLTLQAKLLRAVEQGEVQRVGVARRPPRRRVRDCGDQSRSQGRIGGGTVSRGPVLPSQHPRGPHRAAARAPVGHPVSDRSFRAAVRRSAETYRSPASRPPPSGSCSRRRGPATSASSRTSSSGRASWPRVGF